MVSSFFFCKLYGILKISLHEKNIYTKLPLTLKKINQLINTSKNTFSVELMCSKIGIYYKHLYDRLHLFYYLPELRTVLIHYLKPKGLEEWVRKRKKISRYFRLSM